MVGRGDGFEVGVPTDVRETGEHAEIVQIKLEAIKKDKNALILNILISYLLMIDCAHVTSQQRIRRIRVREQYPLILATIPL
jgi:hypothetical protein